MRRKPEPFTATIDKFPSRQAAENFLYLVMDVLRSEIKSCVADPESGRPVGEEDAALTRLIQSRRSPTRRPFAVTEVKFDVQLPSERRLFSRWAYSSALADVWSNDMREIFEAADGGAAATYYLTEEQMQRVAAQALAGAISTPHGWPAAPST